MCVKPYIDVVCNTGLWFILNDKPIIIVQQVVKHCGMIYEEFVYDYFEHSGR